AGVLMARRAAAGLQRDRRRHPRRAGRAERQGDRLAHDERGHGGDRQDHAGITACQGRGELSHSLSPSLRGEGWGEGHLSTKTILYCGQHTFEIAEHIVVPKSKNAIAFCGEIRIADSVGRRVRVLSSIDLDHEMLFSTNEVADIRADRNLSREFMTVDL